jgi:hypothetical protein
MNALANAWAARLLVAWKVFVPRDPHGLQPGGVAALVQHVHAKLVAHDLPAATVARGNKTAGVALRLPRRNSAVTVRTLAYRPASR